MSNNDAASQPSNSKNASFGGKQWVASILTLVVIVFVFAVVFPSLGNYSDAWTAVKGMSAGWIIGLVVATIAIILIFPWPFQLALPGIRYRPAFVIRQTTFMIGNVIPGGGAIGLGVEYEMLGSYGFKSSASAAAIGITDVANTMVTLALPVLGLVGLILVGEATSEEYVAAIIGVGIIAVAISLITYVLRNNKSARKAGELADEAIDWVAGLFHKKPDVHMGDALVEFRASVIGIVSGRKGIVTGATTINKLVRFSVLFIAILALQGGFGGDVSLIEAFAAYSLARLATFIPIPPGGLGTSDAILIALLTGFGMSSGNAMAADLIWRAATLLPQVLIGLGTLLVWRKKKSKSAQPAT